MDTDAYEIIYDRGVPVIAFQICSDEDEKGMEINNFIPPQTYTTDFEENQTLQYFKEDDIQKVTGQFGSTYQRTKKPLQPHPNGPENKKCKKSDKYFKDEEHERNMDFVIIENETKCNSKKLYDSQGYSYTLRSVSVKEGCSVWRCRFKIDGKECGANIKVTSDKQMIIVKSHRHLPDTPISFALLKNGAKNPIKYRTKRALARIVAKNQSNLQTAPVPMRDIEPKEHKSFKKKSEECDKILDYFSEGQTIESSDDLDFLLDEQDEEDDSYFEEENLFASTTAKESKVAFKVIKNGSITGTHILYDSLGYSYSLVQKKGGEISWCCQAGHSTDGKECKVKVSQRGSVFCVVGDHSHNPKRHTLLKINKMKIFSTDDRVGTEKLVKRKIEQKVVSATKKMKRNKESSEQCLLTVQNVNKEENAESFEFSAKNISFTVSLEEEEEDIVTEGDSEDDAADGMEDHRFNPPEGKRRLMGKVHRSRTVPNVYQVDSFRLLKDMVARVFSTDQAHFLSDIDYHVIENGSNQGGPKLYDSRGYFYSIRNNTVSTDAEAAETNWFCCYRGEKYNCRAKVRQATTSFAVEREHCHPPDKEKYIRSLIRMEAIEMIKDPANLRRSGMSIVKSIIDSYGFQFPFTMNVDHLVRFVNYQKKSFMEHNEIASCRYTFNKKKIPKNFLLNKIVSDYKYHLTFATENQLAYLAAATEWYVDETDFDVAPFKNLFSIHIYTQQQDQPRQIPVFFALISDRQESDYAQVFASIKEALNKPPAVASVIIDLNVPLRKSLAKSFPSSEIKCCDLHWSEDISNKLKEMDLSSYDNDPVTMNYLYQLPLLNLLPRQIFEAALRKIEDEVKDVSVQDLICYIRETFGERSLWPPKYWSSFKMPIQINDHEQWRKDILGQNISQLEVYSFIRNLHMLSESVGDDLRLMSKKKIKKFYLSRPETTLFQVYKEWKSYCKGEEDCHRLLEKLASVIHAF